MSHPLFEGYEGIIIGLGAPIILSIVSAIARVAQFGWHGMKQFAAEVVVSCFVGVCVHWGLAYCPEISPSVGAGLISISAFFSTVILDAVKRRLHKEILHRGATAGMNGDGENGQ